MKLKLSLAFAVLLLAGAIRQAGAVTVNVDVNDRSYYLHGRHTMSAEPIMFGSPGIGRDATIIATGCMAITWCGSLFAID